MISCRLTRHKIRMNIVLYWMDGACYSSLVHTQLQWITHQRQEFHHPCWTWESRWCLYGLWALQSWVRDQCPKEELYHQWPPKPKTSRWERMTEHGLDPRRCSTKMLDFPLAPHCCCEQHQFTSLCKTHQVRVQQIKNVKMFYLVTCEDANTVSVQDIPQPDCAIRWTRGHIIRVWVEAGASDVRQVTSEHPQRLIVICNP